jgi:putative transposase
MGYFPPWRLAVEKRAAWRLGFELTKSQACGIRNVLRAAKRAGDDAYARRLRALLLVGWDRYTTEAAGKILEVGGPCVWGWCRRYRKGGTAALRTGKAPGNRPRLSTAQLEKLRVMVTKGPEANGIDTGVWTAVLVQGLVKRAFAVDFHETHVRRILRRLGFSLQYPKKVLSEASQHEQRQWLAHRYPAIKKKPVLRGRPCSSKTSASSSSKEP